MSQRSPHNARYQKHSKPQGKTRKSAAAAKPKRGSQAKSPTATKKAGAKTPLFPKLPPDVRLWRNIGWGMLAGGVLVSVASLLLRDAQPWYTILLLIAYVLIFGGIGIDFFKVRPTRLALMRGGSVDTAKKKEPAEKSDDDKKS